jgi:hypothetical protein
VETYLPDEGWIVLDPTPALPLRSRQAFLRGLSHLFDYLQMGWYRYVINFGFHDQYRFLGALRRPSQWFDSGLRDFSWSQFSKLFERMPLSAAILVLLVILLTGWTARRRRMVAGESRNHGSWSVTKRYLRFLRLLKKKGMTKRAGETPDEFCGRLRIEKKLLAEEMTFLYQHGRFSSTHIVAPALTRMDQILSELRRP